MPRKKKETKEEAVEELHAVAEATYEMAIDDFVSHLKKTFTDKIDKQ